MDKVVYKIPVKGKKRWWEFWKKDHAEETLKEMMESYDQKIEPWISDFELPVKKQLKVLELFAGSQSFSKIAKEHGHQTFSVDWEKYDGIDLQMDISKMSVNDVPFVPDVIWCSPDCTTYSIAAISKHRNGTEPKSDYAKQCDITNQHFISLIKEWLKINPNMVFFIENPRGMLRKMPWMQEFKRHTIWYCVYGDERAKPTDIWTNSTTWVPRPVCWNGNKDCHHQPAPRGSKTGTQGRKGSYERSKIPSELCNEILKSVE